MDTFFFQQANRNLGKIPLAMNRPIGKSVIMFRGNIQFVLYHQ